MKRHHSEYSACATATFLAEAKSLAPLRDYVRQFLRANGWAARELDITIAVGEVAQNIIRHGYNLNFKTGHFAVSMAVDEFGLLITVEDNAPPSDPASWSDEGRAAHEGGHGLRLIKALSDRATFIANPTGNSAELRFWENRTGLHLGQKLKSGKKYH